MATVLASRALRTSLTVGKLSKTTDYKQVRNTIVHNITTITLYVHLSLPRKQERLIRLGSQEYLTASPTASVIITSTKYSTSYVCCVYKQRRTSDLCSGQPAIAPVPTDQSARASAHSSGPFYMCGEFLSRLVYTTSLDPSFAPSLFSTCVVYNLYFVLPTIIHYT